MRHFGKEFKSLHFVIDKAERFLLIAHNRPDPDTVGSNLAMKLYLESLGKQADIACFHPFPETLAPLFQTEFLHPDQVDFGRYDAIIACDSVDRGFHLLADRVKENQVVALLDHHPDIAMKSDIEMIDHQYSSTCEIVYLYLTHIKAKITRDIATALLTGILFDTNNFQNRNVSPQIMDIASHLMKLGAPLAKISSTLFDHKSISAMKLWGKAFEKARFVPGNGMLVTAVTREDITECQATPDDIYHVSSILSTVPEARFALVLSERDGETVRGSLRASEHQGVDVSVLAHQFGGGGHKLASGFEVKGKIVETVEGWRIE